MNCLLSFLSEWLSRSGDTTFWSWVITLLYAITIVVAVYYVVKIKGKESSDKRFLWICISLFLIGMGINKQLDLQILLTMAGSFIAEHLGWYEYRRFIQKIFTISLIICLSAAGGMILFRVRKIIRQSIVELSGVAILVFFAVIRAGSINHLNKAITFEQEKVSHIHGLELLGLAVILFAALYHLKKKW
jgi:uncharacterized membrane protein YhdT